MQSQTQIPCFQDHVFTYNSSKVIPTSSFRAAILAFTYKPLLFGVGQQYTASATLENLVLSFENMFQPIMRAKLSLLPVSRWPYLISLVHTAQQIFGVGRRSVASAILVIASVIAFLSSIQAKYLLLPVYRPPCWI
jgi:hypothetical protein